MDCYEVVLCSFVEDVASDEMKGHISLFNIKNGKALTPVFHGALADRGCLCSLTGRIVGPSSHFLYFAAKSSTFHISAFLKEKPIAKFYGHEQMTALASDGIFVVGGNKSGSIFIWAIASGALLSILPHAHFQTICHICMSQSFIVSSSQDGSIRVWQKWSLLAKLTTSPLFTFVCHSSHTVTSLWLSDSGDENVRLYSAGSDGSIMIHDLFDGSLMAKLSIDTHITCMVVDSLESKIFVGTVEGTIFVFDIESTASELQLQMGVTGFCSPAPIQLSKPNNIPITSMCLSLDDCLLISGDGGGSITIRDTLTGQISRVIQGAGTVTNCISFIKTALGLPYSGFRFGQFSRTVVSESPLLIDFTQSPKQTIDMSHESRKRLQDLQHLNAQLFDFIAH